MMEIKLPIQIWVLLETIMMEHTDTQVSLEMHLMGIGKYMTNIYPNQMILPG